MGTTIIASGAPKRYAHFVAAIFSRRSLHGDLFTAIFSRRSFHGDLTLGRQVKLEPGLFESPNKIICRV
jgi:hypothetical protein